MSFLKAGVCLFFLAGLMQGCAAQKTAANNSALFQNYQTDKSLLPDFSWAGYHNGEVGIPDKLDYPIFDVTKFGAVPNDDVSDKAAIEKAIAAATRAGAGIVFFPKGRFLVNEAGDSPTSIVCKSSHILFRGSGSGPGGTVLFMKNSLQPADPAKMWTVPPLFIFSGKGKDKTVAGVTGPAPVGSFELELTTTTGIQPGNWIVLTMLNTAPELREAELSPHQASPDWTYLLQKGVDVKLFHQVAAVTGNRIRLKTPVTYNINPQYNWQVGLFANSEEVGIEDIAFVGAWKEAFVHHRSWKDDSGWTLLQLTHVTNAWIKNCRFTDCSVGAIISQSANISVINSRITGNAGHEAIVSNGSTNVFMGKLVDEAGQWHSFGSSHGAMNTVIWNCTYPPTTSFEAHASQPRNTLLDGVSGGLMQNRGGGALQNMPNHMQGLVLWNYRQTNAPVKDFEFWPLTSKWWKIPNPVIVGFTGGSTFAKEQTGYLESVGTPVAPASLYAAQLKMRLNKLPDWLKKLGEKIE